VDWVVTESATPDEPSGWQEMMALLLRAEAAWSTPEEQTCGPERGSAVLERRSSGHPIVKAGVAVAAVVLVALLAMSAISVVEGIAWDVIKIVLLVAVVAGVVHLVRRNRTTTN
jgi:hypothetical protein